MRLTSVIKVNCVTAFKRTLPATTLGVAGAAIVASRHSTFSTNCRNSTGGNKLSFLATFMLTT